MMDHALEAVLWDMDGTVVDSEPLWIDAGEEILARYGLEMSAEIRDSMVGSGLMDSAERFRAVGVPLPAADIVDGWVRSVEAAMARSALEWRPGARELLASLREAGIPSALVTMSVRSTADLVVKQLPAGTFAAVIAGDEVAHSKPHPDPYLRGAAALGVPIERCLAIEDSPTGLRAAFASGAVAIGVPHLVPLDHESAHQLLPSLEGIDAQGLVARFSHARGLVPVV